MKSTKGIVLALISSATFGLIPFFSLPALEEGIGVDSLVFYRFFFSSLFMGVFILFKKTNLRLSKKEVGVVAALGVTYALTSILLTSSYLYVPSGVATSVHFLYPVAVAAIMIAFFKDRINFPVVAAVVLSFLGVYLLSDTQSGEHLNIKGLTLILITVLTYAMYIVGVNKTCAREIDGLKMTFYVLLLSAILFGGQLLAKGEPLQALPNLKIGTEVLLLAFVSTLISNLSLILAIQRIGSTKTAILGCMEPLTAVGVGVLVFGENLIPAQYLGVFLIMLAVLSVILSDRMLLFFRKIYKYVTIRKNFKS